MLDRLANQLDFHSKALVLRAERQRVIASNIANADTPGYVARDLDFGNALKNATGMSSGGTGALSLPMAQHRGGAAFVSTVGLGMGAGDEARPGFIPVSSIGGLPGSGGSGSDGGLAYSIQAQPSMDGNSVDLDRERAAFADNAVHYEATLRFINGSAKTLLTAIQGQ